MLCNNTFELIIQTFFLSILSLGVNRILSGSFFCAALPFWFGWLFLLLGTNIFIEKGLITNFGKLEIETISTFHYGMTFGFILGSLLSIKKNKAEKNSQKLLSLSIWITSKVSDKLLKTILIIGFIFLIQRIMALGLSENFLTDARGEYNNKNFNFLHWIGQHIFIIINFALIAIGINDAFKGIDLKRFLKIILFCSPLFLANSTRTFLLFPLITYLSSVLIMRYKMKVNSYLLSKNEIMKISMLLFGLLLIFSIVGFTRGGYGETFSLLLLIVGWPVSTSAAMESWINVASSSEPTNGLLTFDWFTKTLHRIGFVDYSNEMRTVNRIVSDFDFHHESAAVIPRSIIPDLIFDFGIENLLISSIIVGFFLQFIFAKFINKGIIGHTLAVLLFIGSFMTIQTSILGSTFIVTLFWAFIFFKFKSKKTYV